MSIASAIAMSGINVATLRLQVSAGNIANALSTGPAPASGDATNSANGYVPLQVVQYDTGKGTDAVVRPVSPSLVPAAYNPNAPYTATNGFPADPYLVLTNGMVQLLVARFNLLANAHVLRTDTQLSAALLDIIA